jgi:H+-translocating NAD(P) transhydrogenase subunit alpha
VKIGVPGEIVEGESRVALIPDTVRRMVRQGAEILVQSGAGAGAFIADSEYEAAGAAMVPDAAAIAVQAEVVVKVQPPQSAEVEQYREGQIVISTLVPTLATDLVRQVAAKKVTLLSLNLLPRITRAQSMDVLSSMSTVAGYKAVLLAAERLGKFFPMLMTAAGTVAPAHAFVLGAGVAGLQAIATARRLGANVEAFDTRPVVREQVESLGAKFVEVELDTSEGEDAGGYAKEHSAEFLQKEQELLAERMAVADIVITTALIPGKPAPKIITGEMVQGMHAGSVIVDLAAEMGGNCELTEPGQVVVKHGVIIIGLLNLPATMPVHASQMYSTNMMTLLKHLAPENEVAIQLDDEITGGICVTHAGNVHHEPTRQLIESQS